MTFIQYDHFKNDIAFIQNEESFSYLNLKMQVEFVKKQIQEIQPGSVVALVGDYSIIMISLLIACYEKNIVVIPLLNFQDEKIKKTGSNFYIEIIMQKILITKLAPPLPPPPLVEKLTEMHRPGIILFTSGSSGQEKAVLHDFTKLIKNLILPKKKYRSILFFKFDHIGGINSLLQLLISGGCAIFADKKDPESICDLIYKEKVNLFSTTPSFLGMMITMNALDQLKLSSLERVTYGSEPISRYVLSRWNVCMPKLKLRQTYGTTELGIIAVRSSSSTSEFISLADKKNSYRVINNLLEIKTSFSALGYLDAPGFLNKGGWYPTGDLVQIKNNLIHIIGKKKDIINVGGLKVSPHEVEEVLLKFPGIFEAKVYGASCFLTYQIVAASIFVDQENQTNTFIIELKKFCKKQLEMHKIPVDITFFNPIKNEEIKKKRYLG